MKYNIYGISLTIIMIIIIVVIITKEFSKEKFDVNDHVVDKNKLYLVFKTLSKVTDSSAKNKLTDMIEELNLIANSANTVLKSLYNKSVILNKTISYEIYDDTLTQDTVILMMNGKFVEFSVEQISDSITNRESVLEFIKENVI
jgi:hypothetical protein